MNNDGLYHRNIGLPSGAAQPWAGVLALEYGAHAQQEASRDRFGKLPLFSEVEFEPSDVVEVEVHEGKAVKAVVRFPMEDGRDLVFALLRPVNGKAFVKTVWCNLGSDSHRSLDRSRYHHPVKNFAVA